MADNRNLGKAKKAKNDEFYTQYDDIQSEMNAYYHYDHDVFKGKTILCPCDDPDFSNFTLFFAQNFSFYGLKKLICTSYASASKAAPDLQLSLLETESEQYDEDKSRTHGKIFTLTEDINNDGLIDFHDLEWQYLEGDGDFRSDEVTALRDEADMIITNPPFSLFREFFAWIMEAGKEFSIIGNQNAITYKEIFPYLKNNKIWLGPSIHSGDRKFLVPDDYPLKAATCGIDEKTKKKFIRVKGVRWYTNIEHGRRHEPKMLMTMEDNLFCSRHRKIIENGYPKYDNYDAIEVSYSDAIPKDYDGVMGVPITFMDQYCPEQFEIIKFRKGNDDKDLSINSKCPYFRILIKYTNEWIASNPQDFRKVSEEGGRENEDRAEN